MFSVVKMMKEQGNQFDWSQIAIDIPSLPCFKPEAEWPHENEPSSLLCDGYEIVGRFVVEVTGENPQVDYDQETGLPIFTDCEPIVIFDDMLQNVRYYEQCLIPIRGIAWGGGGIEEYTPETLGIADTSLAGWWFYPDWETGYLAAAVGG